MQWQIRNIILAAGACALLSSCGIPSKVGLGKKKAPRYPQSQAEPATKVGAPYQIGPETYNPADNAQYDEVGYASWYGNELRGNPTANGEPFNPDGISAAHPTLPMPSYVEITHLQSGKTILVRVNDRGPFAKGRLIDLSQGAAQKLGMAQAGSAPVRVRRVNPSDQEKSALREGRSAGDRLDTPEQLLVALRKKIGAGPMQVVNPTITDQPAPQPRADRQTPTGDEGFVTEEATGRTAPGAHYGTKPAQTVGGYYIQIAAFSDRGRANALAQKEHARVEQSGNIYRVRKGPYASEGAAREALGPIAANGYRDARITR
jgi:rare lipoprotein A